MVQRRRTRPAMYELMKGQRIHQGQSSHTPVEHIEYEHDHDPLPTLSWLDRLRAGHSMRVPVGYLILTVPAVLLLLVVAYIFGFSRGETIATNGDDLESAAPEFSINDPLGRPLLHEPGNPTTRPPSTHNAGTSSTPIRSASQQLPQFNLQNLGPIVSDPRQAGVTYYVMVTTNPAGAERVATFCRSQGLAAFVVRTKNERLRQVIALPGFDWEARSTEPVLQLEQLIREVGKKWKGSEPGATDLGQPIRETFKG